MRGLRWEYRRRWTADVEGYVYLDDMGHEPGNRVWHHPSNWLPTLLALRRLRLGPDDVVADLGAGKGAALLVAAEFPVRRLTGVELVEELADVARRNVDANRDRMRAQDVEVVNSDVLCWPIPDDLTVVYLYSPFFGDLFGHIMEHLFEAHDSAPRPLRLVYNYPFEHNRLIATGRARVLDVAPAVWPPRPRWWSLPEVIVTYGVGAGPFPPPRGLPTPAPALSQWSAPNDIRLGLSRPGHPTIYSQP
jgi:SAM-dependent methyltransferase